MSDYMRGSGGYERDFDFRNKILKIDISGEYDKSYHRNDASVFLFLANSYMESCVVLLEHIDKCFQEEKKDIRIIIPFMFNARHYIELELKGLIMRLSSDFAVNTHSYETLLGVLEQKLASIDYYSVDSHFYTRENFKSKVTSANEELKCLKNEIAKFLDGEPTNEYYRYIYNADHKIENKDIVFDYDQKSRLFFSIDNHFKAMIRNLHLAGITIYNP